MRDMNLTQVLLSREAIESRVRELAIEIRGDFPEDLHLVCVLKGAFIFLSDLVRNIPGTVSLDFIAFSSYPKVTPSSGVVRLLKDVDTPLEGRNVVLVDDIVATGLTLAYIQKILRVRSPRALKTACLFSKPSQRQVDVKVEYIGFAIDDRFVVGYGLDHSEQYRNLPYIAVMGA